MGRMPRVRSPGRNRSPAPADPPWNPLPLLLAVSLSELDGPPLNPPSGPVLAEEARAVLGPDATGIFAPMIPLPRILLQVVLARDTGADVADIDRALQDISNKLKETFGPHAELVSSWYRSFLEMVRDSEPERNLRRTLEAFWSTPLEELERLFREHPEIGSAEAITMLRVELENIPSPDQNHDPGIEQYHRVIQGRLALIEGFSQG